MGIGKRIKEARERKGLTQRELGEMVGVTGPAITNYENEVSHPKEPIMYALIDALEVDANFLFQDCVKIKTAPSLPDEAMKIAKVYSQLDSRGKSVVKAVLDFEHAAVVAENSQKIIPIRPDVKVNRRSDGFVDLTVYDQPAAAGLGNYLDDPASHIEQYPANLIPPGTDFGILISGNSMAPDIRDGSTAFVQSRSSIDPGKIGIFLLNGEAYCKKLMVDRYEHQIRLVSLNPEYEDRIIEKYDEFFTIGLVLGSWPQ